MKMPAREEYTERFLNHRLLKIRGLKKAGLFLFFLVVCHLAAICQDIHIGQLKRPPKGFPWDGITSMCQDARGYVWFATNTALYRFDGQQYTLYMHDAANPNSLALNWVECVYGDKNGDVWIGTHGAGLQKLDPATGKFTTYQHRAGDTGSISGNIITVILRDRDGILWVGTHDGLEQFDESKGIFKHYRSRAHDPRSLSNDQVRALFEDRQGTIWVGTGSAWAGETPEGEGGLNKLDKKTGTFTRYLHRDNDVHSLADNRVRAIFEDSRGTFWVGTAGDGLHTMDRATGRFERHPYDPAHPEKLSRPPVRQILWNGIDHVTFINEDKSGKIWIGSMLNGVTVFDPRSGKTQWLGGFSKIKSDLATFEVFCSLKTRDGILWIASWGNNVCYKVDPYQVNLPYNRLGRLAINFTEDSAGLWIGSRNGIIGIDNKNTKPVYYTDKKLITGDQFFYNIVKDNENQLWVGGMGLFRFDPRNKQFKAYHHDDHNPSGLVRDDVRALLATADGKLWVGTAVGLDRLDIKSGVFTHFVNDPKDTSSLSNNIINNIKEDKNRNIWIATTNGGINKLGADGHFKRYITNLSTGSLLCDHEGRIWAGTLEGLYKYDAKKDQFISLNLGLYGYTSSILEDHEKQLWLYSADGILRYNPASASLSLYGKSTGLNPDEIFSRGYVDRRGNVLYGDTGGYYHFQPRILQVQRPRPVVLLSKFTLGDIPVMPGAYSPLNKPVQDTKNITLAHNQNTFAFEYSLIDFINDEGDTHSFYKLENYDNKWRKENGDKTAGYYNVPPGRYIFKVKNVSYNNEQTEKSVTIIILSPWWQTWWARLLFVAAFVSMLWMIIYYRSRRLLKAKRLLEEKVQLRTREVLEQKAEIAAQRDNLESTLDELKTTQTQLIQSEKMASLGELTAGVAHEIQNPLNFVNNFSEVNTELIEELLEERKKDTRDFNSEEEILNAIKENEKKISMHGKRADSIVKSMLEHSRASSGQKELIDINALADEYMRLSYHGLRAKDKTFNAAMETNLDNNLPGIKVVPQDIGRVLLNLFNNAFYAVHQKKKQSKGNYVPEVTLTTLKKEGFVEICVKDNGDGIPENIKDKIMQPFFTTKPTGEGTGLGLSLSYDIVVKGHGGSITVNTKEGEFTAFIISLPI
jgi:signal transduction histidine kinase/ligand-binding sensor domain-containing protein